MRKAVERYMECAWKDEQLRHDALAAWDRDLTAGLHVTAEEADAWSAKLEAGPKAGRHAIIPECQE
jgi:predicted transcriptional regulator